MLGRRRALSLDIRDTGPDADALAEFPGLPELPEVLDALRAGRAGPQGPAPRARPPGARGPGPQPEPEAPESGAAAPDGPTIDGLSLHRLLDRAKPSLAEAAALAGLLLEALGTMHDAGYTHGDLDSHSVQVGLRGDVRLAGGKPKAATRARFDPEQRRADIRAGAGIVAEITKSAGRPARPLTEREEKLVDRLEAAADPRSLSRRGPLKAARGLELAVGPAEARRAARHGIIGLTRAVAAADLPSTDGPDRPWATDPAATATGSRRRRRAPGPDRRDPAGPPAAASRPPPADLAPGPEGRGHRRRGGPGARRGAALLRRRGQAQRERPVQRERRRRFRRPRQTWPPARPRPAGGGADHPPRAPPARRVPAGSGLQHRRAGHRHARSRRRSTWPGPSNSSTAATGGRSRDPEACSRSRPGRIAPSRPWPCRCRPAAR